MCESRVCYQQTRTVVILNVYKHCSNKYMYYIFFTSPRCNSICCFDILSWYFVFLLLSLLVLATGH